MVDSNKITDTEGRLLGILNNVTNDVIQKTVPPQIANAIDSVSVKTGVITRFFPYLDKAKVKLDLTDEIILCKILHRYGGDMIDFYTPLARDTGYDEEVKEAYYIPVAEQHVCVLEVQDKDSMEYLILGYYQNEDIVGFDPAKPGNLNITSITEPNVYWIQFGKDGLDLRLPSRVTSEVGVLKDEMTSIEVYSKDEVDTKIDALTSTTGTNSVGLTSTGLLESVEDYKKVSDDEYILFRGDCWSINNNFESSASITSNGLDDFTVNGTFRTRADIVGVYWYSEDIITHPYISYGERKDYTNVVLQFNYTMSGCKNWNNTSTSDNNNPPIVLTINKTDGSIYYLNMHKFINGNKVTIDFNDLYLENGNTYINNKGASVTVNTRTLINVTDIKSVMLMLRPTNYNGEYKIMENTDFTLSVTNIQTTNSSICKEHVKLSPHKYRLCEGYDDVYNINPYRLVREMRKLGYSEWCDLYIGASHFYEKKGTLNDTISSLSFNHARTEKMKLDKNTPLNKAFKEWLKCYSKELKKNDTNNLVISVSMENLQPPVEWRQKSSNGEYGETLWEPSTFFYSPCNNEVIEYMESVSRECLDIITNNGLPPILQLGEAWWWWNEHKVNQPPCFYDESTMGKYYNENGKELPVYSSSKTSFSTGVSFWLNQQLVEYSDKLRSVVKDTSRYTNGIYMCLFFPPSVLDTDRVPLLMREVNYLQNAYTPNKLDVLQIEDYDWVTGYNDTTRERDKNHHNTVYSLGEDLGFTVDQLHYFGGYVDKSENALTYWRLIKEAMNTAISKGYSEVFVWAGTQIRRDNKMLGYDNYETVQHLLQGL